MKRRTLSEDAAKRFAVRSTKTSAALESRTVPADYVRPEKVEKFLAVHLPRS